MGIEFEDCCDKLQKNEGYLESSKEQLSEIKNFAESLGEDLSYFRDTLKSFIGKIEKFQDSVVEWNSFLDQAEVELQACQKSSTNFEDLEETEERLQVGSFLYGFFI